MINNIQQLLDYTYELEGLLHLSLNRDDLHEDFFRLVAKKGKEIAKLCEDIEQDSTDIRSDEDFKSSIAENNQSFNDINLPIYDFASESDIPETEDVSENLNDISNKLDSISEYVYSLEEPVSPSTPVEKKPNGKLVFSINDKFRFRKELFANSNVEFNNTLALVASMDNYEEAEDYFLTELHWDSQNPVVVEFLNKIKNYFNE